MGHYSDCFENWGYSPCAHDNYEFIKKHREQIAELKEEVEILKEEVKDIKKELEELILYIKTELKKITNF